jgi:hypothetical protein
MNNITPIAKRYAIVQGTIRGGVVAQVVATGEAEAALAEFREANPDTEFWLQAHA